MHTVIFEGNSLVNFLDFMNNTISGVHGKISAMQLYIQDDGTAIFGTNGYTSESLGKPNAPLTAPIYVAQHSGNPYANVPDDDNEDNEGPEDYEILKANVFQQIDALLPRVEKIIDNMAIRIQDS